MSCLHNSSSSTCGIVSISPDRRTRLTRSREDYSLQTNLQKMPKSHIALAGTPCGRRKCGTRESAASGQKCRHSLAPNLLARGREDAKMRSRIEEYTCTHRSNMNLVVAVVLQHELVSPPPLRHVRPWPSAHCRVARYNARASLVYQENWVSSERA
jgi:hypothetical protein